MFFRSPITKAYQAGFLNSGNLLGHILSPMYRFKINPDWSSFINSGKTVLILLAMQEDPNL